MAIELQAKLVLDDELTRVLNRAAGNFNDFIRNVDRVNGRLGETDTQLRRTGNTGSKSFLGSIRGVASLAAGIGTAIGSAKALQASIGEFMKFEQHETLVTAMLDDKKLAKQYSAMVQKMAEESPIMDSMQMMGNSKAFVSITKDMGQLEDAWKIAEKLSIMDPEAGLEGAIFAMKELASGDGVSMAERFEVPKTVVNDIKKLKFEDQLVALEKYLDKSGITSKTVEQMGNTTLSKWNQIKEKSASLFRTMGESSTGALNEAFGKFNEVLDGGTFDKIAKLLGEKLGVAIGWIAEKLMALDFDAIAEGAETAFTTIGEVLDLVYEAGKTVVDNWDNISVVVYTAAAAFAAFKTIMFGLTVIKTINALMIAYRAGTLIATAAQMGFNLALLANPIGMVIAAIAALVATGILLYKNWDTVKAKTLAVWEGIKQGKGAIFLVLGPVGQLIKTAIDMARNWDSTKSVWENVWGAIKRSAADSVNSVIGGINKMIETINKLPGVNIPVVARVDWGEGGAPGSVDSKIHAGSTSTSVNGPHALGNSSGLGIVRGTTFRRLHNGEGVLTATENANYRKIKSGDVGAAASIMAGATGTAMASGGQAVGEKNVTVNMAGANFNVRNEYDIEKIAEGLARKIAIVI